MALRIYAERVDVQGADGLAAADDCGGGNIRNIKSSPRAFAVRGLFACRRTIFLCDNKGKQEDVEWQVMLA